MHTISPGTADAMTEAFRFICATREETGATVTDRGRRIRLGSEFRDGRRVIRLKVDVETPTDVWTAIDLPDITDVYGTGRRDSDHGWQLVFAAADAEVRFRVSGPPERPPQCGRYPPRRPCPDGRPDRPCHGRPHPGHGEGP